MAFQQRQFSPMDYAKKAGKEKRISDVLQDLTLQQTALPGETSKYQTKQQMADIAGNIGSSAIIKGMQTLFAPVTGGASLLADPTILQALTKGGLKLGLGNVLSKGIGNIFNIKPPKAPTVDMSKLIGPGMSGARKTIADTLAVSDIGIETEEESFKQNREMLNLLMSFGSELKETGAMDWIKELMGLSQEGKGVGSTIFSLADRYINK